jgi:EAL domain-containing protein (putative c-di-GMP-specific phosphodiesterase class I)
VQAQIVQTPRVVILVTETGPLGHRDAKHTCRTLKDVYVRGGLCC